MPPSKLKKLELIDKGIKEPAGGAHRSANEVALRIRETIVAQIDYLSSQPVDTLLSERYERLMAHGAFEQA